LSDQIGSALQIQFLGHNTQCTVGGNEVDGLNAPIGVNGEKKVPQKYCAAGASCRDRKVLRWMVGQIRLD